MWTILRADTRTCATIPGASRSALHSLCVSIVKGKLTIRRVDRDLRYNPWSNSECTALAVCQYRER